jgi:hypothetical protein
LPGIRRGIVYSVHEGEADVVDPYRKAVHVLDPVATRILERLDARDSLTGIVQALVRTFDVDEQTAFRDTVEFLAALQEKGLLFEPTTPGGIKEEDRPPPFLVSREQLLQLFQDLEVADKEIRAKRLKSTIGSKDAEKKINGG